MRELIRRHHISFKNAFAGLWWAITTQPNFRIHIALALIVVGIGWYVELVPAEWILLIFTIFWALTGEMTNTAIEAVTDLVTKEWRKEAKIAKDVAAGMMLFTAIGAVLVGVWLLLPKLLLKLWG